MPTEIKISASAINKFIVRWEDEAGCRYHVWIGADGTVEDRVYKNPRLARDTDNPDQVGSNDSLRRNHPEYFNTRHLDGNAKAWKPIMDAIRFMANEGAALRVAAAERQATLDAQNAEAERKTAERFRARMIRLAAWISDDRLATELANHAASLTVAQLIEWEIAGAEPR